MERNKESIGTRTLKGKGWYREKIVEMVGEIEDVWILEQIHKIVINITEEGD